MSIKSAKGQSGTVLLVAVTLGVLLSGFVAIALVQNLPGIFADKVNDAGPITDAESRAEYLVNGYLEQSAKYSFYQAAFEVGNATKVLNNPPDIDDDYYYYGSGHGGWDGSGVPIEEMYDEHFDEIEDRGEDNFESYVGDLESSSPRCNYALPDERGSSFDFDVEKEDPEIAVSTLDDEPLIDNVTCARHNSVRAVYQKNRNYIGLDTKEDHIHEMAWATQIALSEMWNESEEIEDSGNYQGQVDESTALCYDPTAQGPDVPTSVQNAIESQAESTAESRVEQYKEDIAVAGKDGLLKVDDDVGIPLIDTVIDFVNPGFMRKGDSHIPSNHDGIIHHDSSTTVTQVSTSTNDCDGSDSNCVSWSCEGNSGGSKWATDGGSPKPNCEPSDSLGSPSCSVGDPEGEYCDNTSATQSECNDMGDHTWQGSGICDYNNDKPCDDYDGSYDTKESGGNCVLDDNPPEATCNTWKKSYQATYDYSLNSVAYNITIKDDATVPTDTSPSTNIPLHRRFEYNFP